MEKRTDSPEKFAEINYRFTELMKRDPLVIRFNKNMKRYRDELPNGKELTDVEDLSPELKKKRNKVMKIGDEVMKKWGSPLLEGLCGPIKHLKVQKYTSVVSEHLPVSKIMGNIALPEIPQWLGRTFSFRDEHLYLDIDYSFLDMKDEAYVKDNMWKFVKSKIEDKGINLRQKKGWNPPSPGADPAELAFVYHIKTKTFDRYLWWYYLHTKVKLSFRLIAMIENLRKDNRKKAREFLKLLKSKKLESRKPFKGEDKVEKGVKLVWDAIHRRPYEPPKVKHVIEEWNCQEHGRNFSAGCKYCKSLKDSFERAYSMEMGYMPTTSELSITDDAIDTISYVRAGRIARKHKKHNEEHSED